MPHPLNMEKIPISNNLTRKDKDIGFFEDIKKGVENYLPDNNRSQITTKESNTIILDAYNANPTSMDLAIKSFEKLGSF